MLKSTNKCNKNKLQSKKSIKNGKEVRILGCNEKIQTTLPITKIRNRMHVNTRS